MRPQEIVANWMLEQFNTSHILLYEVVLAYIVSHFPEANLHIRTPRGKINMSPLMKQTWNELKPDNIGWEASKERWQNSNHIPLKPRRSRN